MTTSVDERDGCASKAGAGDAEFVSFEVHPAKLAERDLSAEARSRLKHVAALDRPLAWISVLLPLAGLGAALALLSQGYGGWRELVIFAVMYTATITGITVGFHRLFTHRSFEAGPIVRGLLAILGSMAFQAPVIWWAATHRRHHQNSDQADDPHSPHRPGDGVVTGLWSAHIGWLFRHDSMRQLGWGRYAQDLYQDEVVFRIHVTYFYWLLLGLIIPGVWGGLWTMSATGVLLGFLWGGLARIFVSSHSIWALNSLCHVTGSRSFSIAGDHSRNVAILILPTFGEAWHNNHHAFPSSYTTAVRWWQFDPAGLVIRGLGALHLAHNLRSPTARAIDRRSSRERG